MTQLYIDNQEVALPEDFSFDIVRENPLFNKGGDFTFDISLNLDIPVNARLYKHQNRFNASQRFSNRSARLIVDGQTILNGTEIILEINELSASIQLASGNSELNFLVGGSLQIKSLDLGKVPILSEAEAIASREKKYPEIGFVCAPVKTTDSPGALIFNNVDKLYWSDKNNQYELGLNMEFPQAVIRPMPYLNFIIETTLTALGYSIGNNMIRDTVYNKLYIVHGANPTNWAELLDDITVSDFVTEVEKLLDVVFVINPSDKMVDIIFRDIHYKQIAETFDPQNVNERFERKYLNPDEEPESHCLSNIRYNFPDNAYYKYEDVPPEIIKTLMMEHKANLAEINSTVSAPTTDKMKKIYVDDSTGQQYILCKDEKSTETELKGYLKRINTFKRISRTNTSNTMELGIIPAQIKSECITCWSDAAWGLYSGYILLPVAGNYVETSKELLASDLIEGEEVNAQKVEKIQVAFWLGTKRVEVMGKEGDNVSKIQYRYYPFSSTHYQAPWATQKNYIFDDTYATLSFISDGHGLDDVIYKTGTPYDTKEEYTTYLLLDKRIPKPTNIFHVSGIRFICKDIKLKITPDGFDPEYQATLYVMK